MIDLLADRSPKDAVVAIACTWLAFLVALGLALPQPPNPAHVALGALAGIVLVVVGFSAASRLRRFQVRGPERRARLAALSLLAGAVLGAALLGLLVAFASSEPALRARFAGRMAEAAWRPWALAFESSILEEVTFRLFSMSVIAWLVTRLRAGAGAAMGIALVASTLLFGAAHLPAWVSATHATPVLMGAVLLLNGLGGLLLGWVFWRWGLAYAILCHFAGDVVIQALGPRWLA